MNKLFIIMLIAMSAMSAIVVAESVPYTLLNITTPYFINTTQLPFNTTYYASVPMYPNVSIMVSYEGFTSGSTNLLNYSGNSSAPLDIYIYIPETILEGNFTDYVTFYAFEINTTYKVPFNYIITTVSINATNITTNITTNTTTNITTNITTNVTANTTNVTLNYTDFVQFDFNSFEYTLCTYQLPWNRTKDITIRARNGQNVYSDYDTKFFTVPIRTVIPEANYSVVPVKIHIDNGTKEGTYDRNISFSIISNNSYVYFRFVVQNCVRPPPNYDEMIKACSIVDKTPDQQLLCLKLQAEYQQLLYEAMLSASEDKIINRTVKEYVNITERVPVLDLGDPAVVQALKDIPVTWKQMQTDQNQKDLKITQLSTDLTSLRQSFTDEIKKLRDDSEIRITNSLQTLSQDNANKQAAIDKYEEDYLKKATLWAWFGVICFVLACIGGYIYWNENNFW